MTTKNGNTITVHYTGKLENGSKFDSSLNRGTLFSLVLDQVKVIQGWEIGLVRMKVGEKRKLTIPANPGYGVNGFSPIIPPNAALIFEVKVLKIN